MCNGNNSLSLSVLMSLYDKESPRYLFESLNSLKVQSKPLNQLVLVFDGFINDELKAVIDKFINDIPIEIVQLERNRGLSEALNIGLNHCNNDWVVRMDTDDICYPERLEKLSEYILSNPSTDIVGSFAKKIDENGDTGDIIKVPISSDKIRELVWTCPMIHPTVCFKKSKILDIGGYNSKAGPRQDDYDLWFRCVKAGYRFTNISEPLLYYRFTDENIKKNDIKVGYHRFKVGYKGLREVGGEAIAYVGISIPFFRALLPYPLNIWLYKILEKIHPRKV